MRVRYRLLAVAIATLMLAGCSAEYKYQTGRMPGTQVQAAKTPSAKTSPSGIIGAARAATSQTAALETKLSMGVSTQTDVRALLGEPIGRGEIMIPLIDKKPRQMWTYYYETGNVRAEEGRLSGDARRLFMMIYFDDQGHFDGYQWFSSLPQHALRR